MYGSIGTRLPPTSKIARLPVGVSQVGSRVPLLHSFFDAASEQYGRLPFDRASSDATVNRRTIRRYNWPGSSCLSPRRSRSSRRRHLAVEATTGRRLPCCTHRWCWDLSPQHPRPQNGPAAAALVPSPGTSAGYDHVAGLPSSVVSPSR